MFHGSHCDVEEIMELRRVKVDHSTIQGLNLKFSTLREGDLLKSKFKVEDRRDVCEGRREDRYMFRIVDKDGNTVDLLLTKCSYKDVSLKVLQN